MLIGKTSTYRIRLCGVLALSLVLAAAVSAAPHAAHAQEALPSGEDGAEPDADFDEALEEESPDIDSQGVAAAGADVAAPRTNEATGAAQKQLDLIELVTRGGWVMVPILLMSLVVVAFGIERTIGLRRSKVMPRGLVVQLNRLTTASGEFDPRRAYRVCQQYPSSTASVICAMLLKVGRPHSEVEHAVAQASEREASRLHANVRWLTLAAAIAPLMGLWGTVWGMIHAFFQTANLEAGQNRAVFFADGIYIALVTTLGGLTVAIPAAVLAHFFEGRIQTLFHHVDQLLFRLLPLVERYEGKLRVSNHQLSEELTISGLEKLHVADLEEDGTTRPSAAPAPN